MNVLIIGSGGREHALTWKISQSSLVKNIYCAPGNAGMAELAECVEIPACDLEMLIQFAKDKEIDLTVVGPEAPLVAGISDAFEKEGLLVFGPNEKASQLEGSKIFSKEKMAAFNISTARFEKTDNYKKAQEIIESWENFPVVIKADGLAAGKGVAIPQTKEEALDILKKYFVDKTLGEAANQIVIEEHLVGEELSILALTDGKKVLPLPSSQDHKRAYDNDEGPNTGGMGAYSPCPFVKEDEIKQVVEQAVTPMVEGLASEGIQYKGCLYAGLMLTEKGPYVLEYNVRFGDPETQAVLPRLKTDLFPILLEIAKGNLKTEELEWDPNYAVTVVMASDGYPGSYHKGFPIKGLKQAHEEERLVFQAGTTAEGDDVITSGGRVLAVTGFGPTLKAAASETYESVSLINFKNAFYRKDIGKRMYERSEVK